jgi:hypothetical protein
LRLTCRRNHARSNGIAEDSGEIVNESADDNRLVSQSSGWCLRNDWITGGSGGDHVDKRGDDQENPNRELNTLSLSETETTDCYEDEEHEKQANHIDS